MRAPITRSSAKSRWGSSAQALASPSLPCWQRQGGRRQRLRRGTGPAGSTPSCECGRRGPPRRGTPRTSRRGSRAARGGAESRERPETAGERTEAFDVRVGKLAPHTHERMHYLEHGEELALAVVHGDPEAGAHSPCRSREHVTGVRAHRGKDAVMACERLSHARVVEDEAPEVREVARLGVAMNERHGAARSLL